MMPMEKNTQMQITPAEASAQIVPAPFTAALAVPSGAQQLLLRMFADPYALEKEERASLVHQLRDRVRHQPEVAEYRVLLGMALCVDLEPQEAIGHLEEAVRLAPQSFIAQLKLGELWMRLRACEKAEQHTHAAARLACNFGQAELARRQAATLRTMTREGVERGGFKIPGASLIAYLRRFRPFAREEQSMALDIT
jgi:tetratricopeptide (TPR) repeat protein